MQEIKSKRTLKAKHFDLGGNKRRCIASVADVHYRDEQGRLQDIDLTPSDKGTHFENTTAPYKVQVSKTSVSLTYQSRTLGTASMTLVRAGTAKSFNIDPVVTRNKITYRDIVPDCDIILHLYPRGVEWFKVLKSASAPKEFEWQIEHDDECAFKMNARHAGRDKQKRKIELSKSETPNAAPIGKKAFTFAEAFTGRVSHIKDKKTRQRGWIDTPEYPVIIDASITEEVAAGDDDGTGLEFFSVIGGSTVFSSKTVGPIATQIVLETAFAGNTSTFTKFHADIYNLFTNVGIPSKSTINSAVLKGRLLAVVGSNPFLVKGQDDDNAAIATTGPAFFALPRTSAEVTGSITTAETGTRSFSITNIVQEIVNRAGWASGNNMQFFIAPNAALAASDDRTARFAGYGYTNSSKWIAGASHGGFILEIDYTEPSPASLHSNAPFNLIAPGWPGTIGI